MQMRAARCTHHDEHPTPADGAVAGKTLGRRPWLALPAAFASHFVLDTVPHVDSHTLYGAAQGGPTAAEAGVAVGELVLGWLVVVLLTRSRSWRTMALAGAFCGIVIDLVDNVPPWGASFSAWPGTAWLSQLHHGIQPSMTADHSGCSASERNW